VEANSTGGQGSPKAVAPSDDDDDDDDDKILQIVKFLFAFFFQASLEFLTLRSKCSLNRVLRFVNKCSGSV
jgi:hypothetical protein